MYIMYIMHKTAICWIIIIMLYLPSDLLPAIIYAYIKIDATFIHLSTEPSTHSSNCAKCIINKQSMHIPIIPIPIQSTNQ